MYKINRITTDKHNYLQMMHALAFVPKSLYLHGNLPAERRPTVAIIGTRKPSAYGQDIGYRLSFDLAKQGIVIVSGLALGVDAIAHKAALDAGGTTIAVMPGSVDHIYPRSHAALAQRIIAGGGALVSEHPPGTPIYQKSFIERNRIVAGLADGVLVIEAATKSGTIHTAGFALDYGRPVMAVPGNINNPLSSGTNTLIKTGARLVTEASDILDEIGVAQPKKQTQLPLAGNAEEAAILQLIARGMRNGEELQKNSELSPAMFNQTMTMLEITGVIRPLGANQWALK